MSAGDGSRAANALPRRSASPRSLWFTLVDRRSAVRTATGTRASTVAAVGCGAALVIATVLGTATVDGPAATGGAISGAAARPPANVSTPKIEAVAASPTISPRPTKPLTFSSPNPATSRLRQPAHLDTPTATRRQSRPPASGGGPGGHRKMFASGLRGATPSLRGSGGQRRDPRSRQRGM